MEVSLKERFTIKMYIENFASSARTLQCENRNYIFVSPTSDVYYSGIEYIRDKISEACLLYRDDFPIVLDCRRFMQFDATFVDVISAVAKELHERNVLLVLFGISEESQQLMHKSQNINYCEGGRICSDDLSPKKQ